MNKPRKSLSRSTELRKYYLMRQNAKFMINKVRKKSSVMSSKFKDLVLFLFRGGDQRQKGPANKFNLDVDLEHLYLGTTNTFTINRNVYC
jgi:DnaJ-class molecular chaperone